MNEGDFLDAFTLAVEANAKAWLHAAGRRCCREPLGHGAMLPVAGHEIVAPSLEEALPALRVVSVSTTVLGAGAMRTALIGSVHTGDCPHVIALAVHVRHDWCTLVQKRKHCRRAHRTNGWSWSGDKWMRRGGAV